jgi:hypothetical protein
MSANTSKIRVEEQIKIGNLLKLISETRKYHIVDKYVFSEEMELTFLVILNGNEIEIYKSRVNDTAELVKETLYSAKVWFYLLNELDVVKNYFK